MTALVEKMRKRGWAAFMVVTSWKPFPSSLAFYGPFSLCHRWKKHEWTELGVCGLLFLAGNWLLCVFTTQVVRRKVIDKFLGPDVSFWPCVSWAWGCVKMNAFSKLKKTGSGDGWSWLGGLSEVCEFESLEVDHKIRNYLGTINHSQILCSRSFLAKKI